MRAPMPGRMTTSSVPPQGLAQTPLPSSNRELIEVMLFVSPDADTTKRLDKFLADNIDEINRYLYVRRIKVTSKNVAEIKRRGITETPTLVVKGKIISKLARVIQFLTPPDKARTNYGYGVTSADDYVNQYQMSLISKPEDEDVDDTDANDPERRREEIRQKMASMQKRRPEMREVPNQQKIGGGRKLKTTAPAQSKFETDDEFMVASRTDNIDETPIKRYMEEADGDQILENYYLDEAFQAGKKVTKNISKRR